MNFRFFTSEKFIVINVQFVYTISFFSLTYVLRKKFLLFTFLSIIIFFFDSPQRYNIFTSLSIGQIKKKPHQLSVYWWGRYYSSKKIMYFYPIPQKHPPEYISDRALGGGGFLFANCCIPFPYGNYLRLQQTRKPFNAPKFGQLLGRFLPPTPHHKRSVGGIGDGFAPAKGQNKPQASIVPSGKFRWGYG
jgi:hypothetical protein